MTYTNTHRLGTYHGDPPPYNLIRFSPLFSFSSTIFFKILFCFKRVIVQVCI